MKIGGVEHIIGPAQEVKPCEAVQGTAESPPSNRHKMQSPMSWLRRDPTKMEYARFADAELATARKTDEETHESNKAALEANAKLHAAITAVMEAAKIPKSFLEPDRTSRSRWPRSKTVEAGYLGDLKRSVVISDGFDYATMVYNRRVADYAKYRVEAEEEQKRLEAEAARAEQAKIDRRKADLELVTIQQRYGLPITHDWEQVLEELRKKSKYVDLAVAGEQTRGDWSEGFYRVEEALGRFTIESNRDKDIAADLLGCIRRADDDGERDGRVFRDTIWSYSALYTLVEPQLAKDVQTALSHCRD